MNPKYKFWHINLHKMFDVVGISWFDKGIDEIRLFDAEEGIYLSVYPNEGHLLRFTEMLDKNGKEIFEGYIVRMGLNTFSSGELVTVRYYNGMFEPVCFFVTDAIEVIGNIYENPELLKKE